MKHDLMPIFAPKLSCLEVLKHIGKESETAIIMSMLVSKEMENIKDFNPRTNTCHLTFIVITF